MFPKISQGEMDGEYLGHYFLYLENKLMQNKSSAYWKMLPLHFPPQNPGLNNEKETRKEQGRNY